MTAQRDPLRRSLHRRETLAWMGSTAVVLCLGGPRAAAPAGEPAGCVLRPQQAEGPYFVDPRLNRSDLRSDPDSGVIQPGLPLQLELQVSQLGAGACTPLAGARIDLWHCDARGAYSDVEDRAFDTRGRRFLRGYQITGDDGSARFTTIYPGAYPGRAVHVHFKIRPRAGAGSRVEFTSQLYFDDALTDRVHAQPPYAGSAARTRNADDALFASNGSQLLLALAPAGEGAGYRSVFAVAIGKQ
jgi:protocatechuate 3,4-dioxygenase beta subunit